MLAVTDCHPHNNITHPFRHVPPSSCCQVAVLAYRILLKELLLPHKGLNQELVNINRAASLPLGLYDVGSVFRGTVTQPVTGPSLGQSGVTTAALQAL